MPVKKDLGQATIIGIVKSTDNVMVVVDGKVKQAAASLFFTPNGYQLQVGTNYNPPTPARGDWYYCDEDGTYTNFGNQAATKNDRFIWNGSTWDLIAFTNLIEAGYKGVKQPADAAIASPENSWWVRCGTGGTFTNYSGLVCNAGDILAYNSAIGAWEKELGNTGLYTLGQDLDADGHKITNLLSGAIEAGNTDAVNGQAVNNSIIEKVNNKIGKISKYGDLSSYTSTSSGDLLFLNSYTQTNGFLTKFSILCSGSGTIDIVKLSKEGSVYTIEQKVSLSVVSGLNEFNFIDGDFAEVYIYKNELIAIQTNSVGVRYDGTAGDGYYYFAGAFSYGDLSFTGSRSIKYEIQIATDLIAIDKVLNNEGRINILESSGIENKKFNEVSSGETEDYSSSVNSPITVFNNNVIGQGKLKQVSINVKTGSGTDNAKIKHIKFNRDKTVTVLDEQTITLKTGINIFMAGIELPNWELGKGETIAIYTSGSTASVKYQTSGGNGYYFKLGDAVSTDVFTITKFGKISMKIEIYEFENEETNFVTIEEYDLTAIPSGWTALGGQAADGTKINSVSNISPLYSDLDCGADDRQIKWRFRYTDAAATVFFTTKPLESGINAGSCISVNQTTLKINGSTASGNYVSTVMASQALNYNLTVGNYYDIIITKIGRKIVAVILGVDDNVYATVERLTEHLTYTIYPTFRSYDQGTLQGGIGCGSTGGGAEFYKVNHRLLLSEKIEIAIFGDSITEGFTLLNDDQRFSVLLKNEFGNNKVFVSGIGGAVTDGVIKRINSELSLINTKYCFIFIGSNSDASFADNIQTIVTLIKLSGIIPIVASIPNKVSESATVKALPSDVIKCLLDVAMTATGGGSTRLVELYENIDESMASFNDSLHPNSEGHQIIFKKIMQSI